MAFDWIKPLKLRNSLPHHSIQRRRRNWLPRIEMPLEVRQLLSANVIGSEFRVNTFTNDEQKYSVLAMDNDGDYVVTWQSDEQDGSSDGIYAQRYNSAGQAVGSEFRVNSYTNFSQGGPSVAMDGDGDFVITWLGNGATDGVGIYAQRYSSSGETQGSEFRVNSDTTNLQLRPSIAMDSDGNFVIAWEDSAKDGSDYGVYAQRYNSAGQAVGSEFRVNSYTTGKQWLPSVAMDSDGDFLISWTSVEQDGSGDGIYAQRYNSAGQAVGSEFRVNSYTTGKQWLPSVAMDSDGDFLISWTSVEQDGSSDGIYAQRYNSAGQAVGSEFRVNSYTTGSQTESAASISSKGYFIVTWTGRGAQDGNDDGVYAQLFNNLGQAVGSEFRVNSFTTGKQWLPSVAMDSDGDFLISWTSVEQDGSGLDVYAQRYRVSQTSGVGIWRSGKFYLDSNHSGTWNGTVDDTLSSFGISSDKPLVGDWNGDGYDDIGVWRNGTFYLDTNGNGKWDGSSIDKQFVFGSPSDTPIVGDWNKDGKDEIGVWRSGKFYLDLNGNRAWNPGVDLVFPFGSATDTPVVGDWNGDGIDDVGIRRNNFFYLDSNGNRAWNSGADKVFSFGNAIDTPIVGDWNGDGEDDVGVWRSGKFYLDSNGNHAWNSGVDSVFSFGAISDTPLIGYWRPKTLPGDPPVAATIPVGTPRSGLTFPAKRETTNVLATLISPRGRKRRGEGIVESF